MTDKQEPLVCIASAPLGNRWSDYADRHYLEQIPVSLHRKLNAYRNWADKQRSVIGRLLLAKLLHRYGFSEEALGQIKLGRYGKPYLEEGFHFNIAHAADRIVCVGSRTVAVGIDIECMKPIDFSDFEPVMSPAQWQQINRSTNSLHEFWRFWTLKEAIAKADGRGIGLPLAEISVDSNEAMLDQNPWYLIELKRWDRYCGFLASDRPVDLTQVCFDDYVFE